MQAEIDQLLQALDSHPKVDLGLQASCLRSRYVHTMKPCCSIRFTLEEPWQA